MRRDLAIPSLPRAFSALLQFYRQAEQTTQRIERFYTVAGYTICLRFAGPALVPAVTNALAHLATSATRTPDLTICLADSHTTGIAMPPSVWEPGIYNVAQGRLYFYQQPQWQEGLMPRFRLAIIAVTASADYPRYAHAAPLRNILTWWLASQGLYGLHVAAVGNNSGAALIVGDSGAGKSTTAIACLHAGLTYLGDDYCVLGFDPAPRIHSLYSSGKLCDDSRRWLNPCELAASGWIDDHKMIYQWYSHFQAQLLKTLPLQAILLPTFSGAASTTLNRAAPSAAFIALTTTTLRVMSLSVKSLGGMVGAISRLTRQVPCYHLGLGTDTAQIPATIARVLETQEA